jgi:prepilin-type N-terminal cleavage/methylation domain-containing protein
MIASIRKQRAEEGFTLIELLIVITILGVLVAIVLFGVGTFKTDSQAAACKTDTHQLQTAETAYFAKTGKSENAAALVTSGYLQSAPTVAADGVALDVGVDTTTGVVTVTGTCGS